jgi:uncharacterized protein YjbJ (UPF0337 family)
MDKDRIKGSAGQAKGAVKEAKLETEGKADKAAGKVQNAVGGLKVRCAANKAIAINGGFTWN